MVIIQNITTDTSSLKCVDSFEQKVKKKHTSSEEVRFHLQSILVTLAKSRTMIRQSIDRFLSTLSVTATTRIKFRLLVVYIVKL